jgi:O-antigen ligase
MKVLMLFVFSQFCRLSDFSHGVPFLILGMALIILVCVSLGGDLLYAVKSRPGMLLIGLTLWIFLGVPFSVAPLEAWNVASDLWVKSVMVFFLVAAGTLTFGECRKLLYAVAFATAMIDLFTSRYGYIHGGRLAVGGGTLSNSNGLAMFIVVGLPFCAYAFCRASRIKKVFWGGVLLVSLNYLSKTGSRGALLAVGLGVAYVFYKSSLGKKAVLAAALLCSFIVAPLVIPSHVYMRYASMFTDSNADSEEYREAEASKAARLALLKKSIEVTIDRPVFGAGVGQFMHAASELGSRVTHVSHNMYTQISSETGIPGFLMYMGAIALCIRSTGKLLKLTSHAKGLIDIYQAVITVRVAFIIFLAVSFFGNSAYEVPIMILLGLAQALDKTVRQELAARTKAPTPSGVAADARQFARV